MPQEASVEEDAMRDDERMTDSPTGRFPAQEGDAGPGPGAEPAPPPPAFPTLSGQTVVRLPAVPQEADPMPGESEPREDDPAAFDPRWLDGRTSLNRLQIASAPFAGAESMVGQRGVDLLGLGAVAALIQAHAGELAIPPAMPPRQLPHALADRLNADAAGMRASAHALAETLGLRLAAVVAALVRGDHAERAANPAIPAAAWAHWRAIRQVIIGGGLATGVLGSVIATRASSILGDCCDVQIVQSGYGSAIALVGAARLLAPAAPLAPVLDFGQSHVKRGFAHVSGGQLHRLDLLEAIPARYIAPDERSADAFAVRQAHFNWLVACCSGPIVDSGALAVALALAAYMRDGQPLNRAAGAYADLRWLGGNLRDLLAEALSERCGRPIHVHLIHDGRAAALAHAPQEASAVITLGTGLGIGFVPAAELLLALAPGFQVRGLHAIG
jgi:hypothetical protein